ncbi:hypothetical protein QTP88_027299 [Uroleucon formosanum]
MSVRRFLIEFENVGLDKTIQAILASNDRLGGLGTRFLNYFFYTTVFGDPHPPDGGFGCDTHPPVGVFGGDP